MRKIRLTDYMFTQPRFFEDILTDLLVPKEKQDDVFEVIISVDSIEVWEEDFKE